MEITLDNIFNTPKSSSDKPAAYEYPEHLRPGMGTENIAPFLKAMVQMTRPARILEIGAGYTTPFLLEALVKNVKLLQTVDQIFGQSTTSRYDPKLVVIDDVPLFELGKRPGMKEIIESKYTEIIEGLFQGKAMRLKEKYGEFDFVWFDCGEVQEYEAFFSEYWSICSRYIFFHYTFTNGKGNQKLDTILKYLPESSTMMNIVEPHKFRQGSVSIIKKTDP